MGQQQPVAEVGLIGAKGLALLIEVGGDGREGGIGLRAVPVVEIEKRQQHAHCLSHDRGQVQSVGESFRGGGEIVEGGQVEGWVVFVEEENGVQLAGVVSNHGDLTIGQHFRGQIGGPDGCPKTVTAGGNLLGRAAADGRRGRDLALDGQPQGQLQSGSVGGNLHFDGVRIGRRRLAGDAVSPEAGGIAGNGGGQDVGGGIGWRRGWRLGAD